ncbi:MAG: cytochrome c family protein [Tagaea sp.]|nr:cytochrome c family protein [Tagaea sp.]
MRFVLLLALGLFASQQVQAAGDPVRGAEVFRKCVTCHTVESGGRNRVGPRLHGVFGRRAGTVEGFRYSDALRASGLVWDDTTLDAYLKDSEGFVPGTRMYGGLTLDQDRADLIAYLRQATR